MACFLCYDGVFWVKDGESSSPVVDELVSFAEWACFSVNEEFAFLARFSFHFFSPFFDFSFSCFSGASLTGVFLVVAVNHSVFPSPGCLMVSPIFGFVTSLKLTAMIFALHWSPMLSDRLLSLPESVLSFANVT